MAQRGALTSNSGAETNAAISPDGQTVAFVAEYEGPSEVYTIPISGGLPQRRTWDGDALPAAWAPDGRLLVRTRRYSTLPDPKLVLLDSHGSRDIVPLAEGSQDQYYDVTEYVQRDPANHFPGVFAFLQMTKDANPGFDSNGNPFGPTTSHGGTIELYQPIGDKTVLSVRKEWLNDGLGNATQQGVIDLNYHLARFLFLYGEVGMAQNSTPAWRYTIWWTLPIQSVK